jgi:hypothetical protein
MKREPIELTFWFVLEDAWHRHLCGQVVNTERQRVSSPICGFDAATGCITTASGQRYLLLGEPRVTHRGAFMCAMWCKEAGIGEVSIVSDEYWSQMQEARSETPRLMQ